MANLNINKVIASVPSTIIPNTVYAVRVGTGFDLYISDNSGAVAHAMNVPKQETMTQAAYDALPVKDPNTYYYIQG